MRDLLLSYSVEFFSRPTVEVARDLLGAILCRRLSKQQLLWGTIVEVEAYTADDPACHASKGYTSRSSVMFGPPGHAYVYFIYGMYYCLNVVTEPCGTPGAVLIRSVDASGTNGPGKLCRQWQINSTHNGLSLLVPESQLWVCPGEPVADQLIATSSRIGISKATELPWRFYLKDHPAVSKAKLGKQNGSS